MEKLNTSMTAMVPSFGLSALAGVDRERIATAGAAAKAAVWDPDPRRPLPS